MNWKRGSIRLWVIASFAWMIYVFVAADVPKKIVYAWRYYVDYEGLQKEADKHSREGNPYLALMDEQPLQQAPSDDLDAAMDVPDAIDANPDEVARQKRIAQTLNVPLASVQADPAFSTKEDKLHKRQDGNHGGRKSGVDAILAAENLPQLQDERDQEYWDKLVKNHPEIAKKYSDADFTKLAQPAKPEWKWLAAMFLPPTVGVFMAWMLLHMALKTGRWVWLGFKN